MSPIGDAGFFQIGELLHMSEGLWRIRLTSLQAALHSLYPFVRRNDYMVFYLYCLLSAAYPFRKEMRKRSISTSSMRFWL